MQVRIKTLLIIGLIFLVLLASLAAANRWVVLKQISALNQSDMRLQVRGAKSQLDNAVDTLQTILGDWASWDDTYQFIENRSRQYISDNLVPATFQGFNINFMLFFNRSGKLVCSRFYDPSKNKLVPADTSVLAAISAVPKLIHHASVQSLVGGLLMDGRRPIMIVSQPILKSNCDGPIRGAMIMGRYLGHQEISALSRLIQLPLKVIPAAGFALPKKKGSGSIWTSAVGRERIAGYGLVNDINGSPAVVLKIVSPRTLYRSSLSAWWQYVLLMILIGAAFIGMTMLVMEKAILRRIRSLNASVDGITRTGSHPTQLPPFGRDEIGQLASSINGMLKAIAQHHEWRIESERRFRAIVEDQSELICRFFGDGRLTFVNDAFINFFGKSATELLENPFYGLFPGESPEGFQHLLAGMNPGDWVAKEHLVQKANGEARWLQWRHRQLAETEDGFEFQSVGRDITEQKTAEISLRENERYLRDLLDSINSGVLVIDAVDRRIVDANDTVAALIGLDREAIIGQDCHRFVCPAKDGPCPLSDPGRKINLSEGKITAADGNVLPILLSLTTTEHNGRRLLIESVIDIRELKKTEAKLCHSEERYRRFFREDITGNFIFTPEGRIIDCNPAVARIFGFDSEAEIRVIPMSRFYPALESQAGIIARLKKERRLHTIQWEFKHRDGHPIHCIANLIGEFDDAGRLIEIRGYLFDDTKRVLLENSLRQAHKLEAIGTLAGGIAHDFNNILAGIIGFTELAIQESPGSDRVVGRLRKILQATARARDLVGQILTFSRQTEPDARPLRILPLVKEVTKLMRAWTPSSVEIRLTCRSDATVVADPTQIHQVLMNLCTNASQAMGENGGTVEILVENVHLGSEFVERQPQIAAGEYLCIAVRDTGHGILPEVIDRIFDPFFTTKEKSEGTGMGLSVAHGIVKQIGGLITVDSTPGLGATFCVYLPRAADTAVIEEPEPARIPVGTERVIIVDDEPFQVETNKELLENLGYRVEAFTDPETALAHFQKHVADVDLVITDLTMPHMAGTGLAQRMIAARPDLPIVLCTGYSERLTADRGRSQGIRALLQKPVKLAELAQVIRNVLDGSEPVPSAG